ncbi:hypothetical protein D3H65_23545 [Paraflavitalea soli]|uniref:Glycosyltransferase RgtA/B/C/D-like domain-containing protein n=2 Tax=Paraflavitalea soli TaxID=2315862 RepID=A0A3B7MYH5_9BACT|nr:hypothetical protein D3H65_23545 [Paraflavitalea soli]
MHQGAGLHSSLFYNRLWIASTGILIIIYFANCFTPFRLTNDTVRYFTLLEDLQGTLPAGFEKPADFLPFGYVYFLAGLSTLHLLTPFGIGFFQLLYLCGSLYFVKKLFGASIKIWPFVFLTLLNWTTLKLTITPLSEMQFLFFSTAALYCYQSFMKQRKAGFLILTVMLCLVCFITRTAGIGLVLALIVSFLISSRKKLMAWSRQQPFYAVLVIIIACSLLGFLVTRPKFIIYLSYFLGPLLRDPATFFSQNVRLHLVDWAELFINIPISKTGFLVSPVVAEIFYILTGLFFLGLLTVRLIRNHRMIPLPVIVYLIIYTLLIFNWPFFEARFWFPLVPLLAAILVQQGKESKPLYQKARMSYLLYYVATGIFVLGYYSRMSFDRPYLVKKHDAGKWQAEYEDHFGIKRVSDSSAVNKKAIYLLNKYD